MYIQGFNFDERKFKFYDKKPIIIIYYISRLETVIFFLYIFQLNSQHLKYYLYTNYLINYYLKN